MSRKSVQNAINSYQRARLCFIQNMSILADKASTRAMLQEMNILDLVMPLLNDKVSSIQQGALATLGKMLCAKNLDMTRKIRETDLLRVVLKNMSGQNKHYKRSALHILACAVGDSTCEEMIGDEELKTVIECLEDSEPETRASAALALGGLAKNEQIAGLLVQSGTLAALTQILASPELPLKQAAAFALGNIAKHSEVFAEHIADCNVIPLLVKAIHNDHVRLKADGFLCLANIARHSPGLATEVAESGLNEAIEHLSCQPGIVQKQAATLVRDICRHNLRLSNMVVMSNGLGSLVNLVQCGNDCSVLPAVMALGYMSAQSEQVAEQIIDLDAVHSLQCTLDCEGKEQLQAAAAWTLGQIGKHSVDNVKALTVENVLSTLVQKIGSPHVSENLKTKCRSALRLLLPKCEDTKDLENILMGDIPEALIAPILSAFSKILPCYPETKVTFVTSGCLRKIQELEPDQETAKYIQTIQDSFPPEVVQFVSPSYLESLIKTLDTFVPENISNMPLCQDLTNLASLESVKSVSDSVKSDILPNDSNES